MRKLFAGTAAVLAAVLLLSCPVSALSAQKAILTDGLTGQVLFEKAADSKSLIASTTKIMTALLVCENENVLDLVQVPAQAVGIEGSSIYLKAGEVVSVQELLYGMMLCSGNDAATALAIHCAGSVAAFVQMMNVRAAELGLSSTHFANPHGLDAAEHYSTARDLAKLAGYAMQNPLFAQTVATKSVRIGTRQLTNHNKLLWRVQGAQGVKTGYTRAAGRILVSSVQRQGRRLIAVTIDDGNDWADHAALYAQGFAQFTRKRLVSQGQVVGTVPIFGGVETCAEVVAVEDFYFPVAAAEQINICLSQKTMAFAPVVQGADAGFAYIRIGGRVAGKVAVQYAKTVEQQPPKPKGTFWRRWFGGSNDGTVAKNTIGQRHCFPPSGGADDP